jgi:hypothetical protein
VPLLNLRSDLLAKAAREGLAIRQIAMLSIPERPGHRVDRRVAPGLTAPEMASLLTKRKIFSQFKSA